MENSITLGNTSYDDRIDSGWPGISEVAPLLMVGVVKLAPALPVDGPFTLFT